MLSEDLMANIQRLPLDEKLILLEVLMRTVNEEVRQQTRGGTADPDITHALATLGANGPFPPFEDLQGVLASDTPIPVEYDWKDDYADYLTQKYA